MHPAENDPAQGLGPIARLVEAAEERMEAALDEASDWRLPRDPNDQPYIETVDQAEWAMRKLARLQRQRDEVAALYRSRRAALDAWWADEQARFDRERSWFDQLLERFHRTRLADDPSAKTIRLPSGRLTARWSSSLAVDLPADELAEELDRVGAGDLVSYEPKVGKADLKSRLKFDDDGAAYVVTDEGEQQYVAGVRLVKEQRFSTSPDAEAGS